MPVLDVKDLTNVTSSTSGTGVFDVLIDAVELRIENQYNKGRLKGTDYANVYLGSMQAVLQQAVTFMLQKDKVATDIEYQNSKKEEERNLVEAQLEQEWGYDVTRDATTGDLVLGSLNTTGKIDKAKKLLDSQNIEVLDSTVRANTTLTQDILNKAEQVTASVANTARADAESTKNLLLVQEKIESENKNNEAGGVIDLQKSKLAEEDGLLKQKHVTEFYQTGRTHTEMLVPNTLVAVDTPVSDQSALLKQQAKSLKWNADQKYLNTLLSTSVANAGIGEVALNSNFKTTLTTDASGVVTGDTTKSLNIIASEYKPV